MEPAIFRLFEANFRLIRQALRHLNQKVDSKMSDLSNALDAATAASIAKDEAIITEMQTLNANVAVISQQLADALAKAGIPDADLSASAQAAVTALNNETARSDAALQAIINPPVPAPTPPVPAPAA